MMLLECSLTESVKRVSDEANWQKYSRGRGFDGLYKIEEMIAVGEIGSVRRSVWCRSTKGSNSEVF